MTRKRILSGMRPTGRLHLGNLHGALGNWVELQNSGNYDCFYFVADWHAITSEYASTQDIRQNSLYMVMDWLAAGLDPAKSTLFVQSAVKEHAELFLLLSMITPLAWLTRNPTYKEMQTELSSKDLSTFGFLGYPVLQAADIVMYKAYGVPVGVDQLPHIELTREIARRFNYLYQKDVFPVPEPLLTQVPKLLGIDGRKMSKSYDNAVYLSDRGKTLHRKIASMFTDPQRMRKKDPGDPDICNVFTFHGLYSPAPDVAEINRECRTAGIGCTDCKKMLAARVEEALAPVHERMDYYQRNIAEIEEMIQKGNDEAAAIARRTMAEVREAVKI
ncbi:MAG: tryptophan--tRNA ligase [Smithellaceae bacterium]|nr:tryptophan--tRNA ligase [Smithellaceae bacterium]MDD3258757.1 tryptophan--tRNA ligase [Smithellaceae bacterium]MDD3848480.1 tryptophan--tRNA ligase [Smithellaceae bacterium]HOG12015.1 tryptophan--tRNA ligase [Smithellaceae bacterium]HOQ71368.1 tryptophan--tRNA ligase [Smithellaceae bacterium]